MGIQNKFRDEIIYLPYEVGDLKSFWVPDNKILELKADDRHIKLIIILENAEQKVSMAELKIRGGNLINYKKIFLKKLETICQKIIGSFW